MEERGEGKVDSKALGIEMVLRVGSKALGIRGVLRVSSEAGSLELLDVGSSVY